MTMMQRNPFMVSGILFASLAIFLAAPPVAQAQRLARSTVFLTPVINRHQPISRTNVFYLPPPAAAAITAKPSGGSGGHKGGSGSGATCPTSSTTTYSAGCPVAPTTSVPEAEEEIAADPSDSGQTYISVISDFSLRGGYNTTKWAITSTGGGSSSSWSQSFIPLNSSNQPNTSDGMAWDANSDPVAAIDRSGNVYLSDLFFTASLLPNGLYVNFGTLNNLEHGGNFEPANPVAVNTTGGGACALTVSTDFCLEDKPWIAVDNSTTPPTVYVTWSHFVDCENILGIEVLCGPDYIEMSSSLNQGLHWSTPVRVSPSTQDGDVQGSQVAVGADGTVYITYEVFDPTSNTRWQYFTSRAPGASSFSTPVPITPGFQELTFNSNYRTNSFPALAIGPTGQVDVEYAAQPGSNAEVFFTSCPSSCSAASPSFSSPIPINPGAGQEFFPAISVDPSDVVHTSWFDTRNSPSNTADFDVYATFNSGTGFDPTLARVTPSTINTGSATFIGDYSGIAAAIDGSSSFAHPVWNNFSETCHGIVVCQVSGTMQTTTLTLP
jgi:hypothetical protein